MKRIMIMAIFSVFLIPEYFAQQIYVQRSLQQDTLILNSKLGPNRKNFDQAFVSTSMIVDQPGADSITIKPLRSFNIAFGYRHKQKMNEYYSVGLSVLMALENYYFKPFSGSIDTAEGSSLEKEKYLFVDCDFELYMRFNFKKRGNILGTYLDIGGYASLPIFIKHTQKWVYEEDGILENQKEKRVFSGLNYTNWYNYGVKARFGRNALALTAQYRLSDVFNSDSYIAELPRLSIGLELSIFEGAFNGG